MNLFSTSLASSEFGSQAIIINIEKTSIASLRDNILKAESFLNEKGRLSGKRGHGILRFILQTGLDKNDTMELISHLLLSFQKKDTRLLSEFGFFYIFFDFLILIH